MEECPCRTIASWLPPLCGSDREYEHLRNAAPLFSTFHFLVCPTQKHRYCDEKVSHHGESALGVAIAAVQKKMANSCKKIIKAPDERCGHHKVSVE